MKNGTNCMLSLSFVIIVLLNLFQGAECHGFLLQPMSRTFVSFKFDPPETRDYNPQGANAGGKQKVYNNGQLSWPHGKFGLCGDAWDAPDKRNEQPGQITASYAPGSTISIHMLITANHWGRMEFNLCPPNVTAATFKQRCTLLQRADGKGAHWTLPPGELPDPQGRPLVPAYKDGTFSYYIYPENDDFRDTPVFVVKYALPQGVSCEGCVLHWYWLTGNSCNPPCEASDPLFPDCNRLQMGFCGQPSTQLPEEFWGCSDIHIGHPAKSGPVLSSNVTALTDLLEEAAAQGDAGRPAVPERPTVEFWKQELLDAAEQLDARRHRHPPRTHRHAEHAADRHRRRVAEHQSQMSHLSEGPTRRPAHRGREG